MAVYLKSLIHAFFESKLNNLKYYFTHSLQLNIWDISYQI